MRFLKSAVNTRVPPEEDPPSVAADNNRLFYIRSRRRRRNALSRSSRRDRWRGVAYDGAQDRLLVLAPSPLAASSLRFGGIRATRSRIHRRNPEDGAGIAFSRDALAIIRGTATFFSKRSPKAARGTFPESRRRPRERSSRRLIDTSIHRPRVRIARRFRRTLR